MGQPKTTPTLAPLEPVAGRTWCALHTRARHEKKIAAHCAALGIPAYLPLRISRTISGGKINTFHVPMFPGYVFAALVPGEAGRLKRTNSLAQQIPTDDEHGLLRDLRAVRLVEQARLEVELSSHFEQGDRVRVGAGPLAGVEGIVFRQKNRSRFQVAIDAIHQALVVDVAADSLIRVEG